MKKRAYTILILSLLVFVIMSSLNCESKENKDNKQKSIPEEQETVFQTTPFSDSNDEAYGEESVQMQQTDTLVETIGEEKADEIISPDQTATLSGGSDQIDKSEMQEVDISYLFSEIPESLLKQSEIYCNNRKIVIKNRTVLISLENNVNYFDLKYKIPFYKSGSYTIDVKNLPEKINFEPIHALVKLTEKKAVYDNSDRFNNIKIYVKNYKNFSSVYTDISGIAKVPIPYLGKIDLVVEKSNFYKSGIAQKEITNPDSTYQIFLIPVTPSIYFKIIDNKNNPVSNQKIQLIGNGIALSGKTNKQGVVKFTHHNLKSGKKYDITMPNLGFTKNGIEISNEQINSRKNYIKVEYQTDVQWTIESDKPGSRIEIYDYQNNLITEGQAPLKISLPIGSYKAAAYFGNEKKQISFNSSDSPNRLIMFFEDCYNSSKKWVRTTPEGQIPMQILNCLRRISPSDNNYLDAKILLLSLLTREGSYEECINIIEEIFRVDSRLAYNPSILYQAAQARVFYSEQIQGKNREILLTQALDYCERGEAYYLKLPPKLRKEYMLRFKYIRGEINYKLFDYYRVTGNEADARRFGEITVTIFEEFINDFKSLGNSDQLKTLLTPEYRRAMDLKNITETIGYY